MTYPLSQDSHAFKEDIDDQVNKLYSEIALLKHLQNQRLSVIHKIPDEILSMIFSETVDTNRFNPSEAKTHSRSSQPNGSEASLLGTVCSKWRRVAVSTPQIWSRISIVIQFVLETASYDSSTSTAVQNALRIHLKRSGDVSLDVRVILDGGKSHWKHIHYSGMDRDSLARILLGEETFGRIGALDMKMDADCAYGLHMIDDLFTREPGSTRMKVLRLGLFAPLAHGAEDRLPFVVRTAIRASPALEVVTMDLLNQSYSIFHPQLHDIFEEHAERWDMEFDRDAFFYYNPFIPPSLITHIELVNPVLERCGKLLASCPALESLHLDLRESPSYTARIPHFTDIRFDSLRELQIHLPQSRNGREKSHIPLKNILDGIASCMSLSSLSIHSSDLGSDSENIQAEVIHTTISDLITRKACSLERLSLTKMPLATAQLSTILANMPQLIEVELVEQFRSSSSEIELGIILPGIFKSLSGVRKVRMSLAHDDGGDKLEAFCAFVKAHQMKLESAVLEMALPSHFSRTRFPTLFERWEAKLRDCQQDGEGAAVRVMLGSEEVIGHKSGGAKD